MDGLKSYLISVCSAAILCAILKHIGGKAKITGVTMNVLCGLFVAICIIAPWKDFTLRDLEIYNPLKTQETNEYTEAGKEMMENELHTIIINQTESYILEKANQMHLQLEVRVELSEDGIPDRSIITGSLSPVQKEELSAFLLEGIGIQKEMQIWN